jgi:flavin-dependent thymidylate synthase
MRVTLINYTPFALETLIFTKSTRLKMSGTGLRDIIEWPLERKLAELEYMKSTIQSSWEFVDYIFMIEGVSRAFTHQLVRHRVGTSFAQQAQRAVDMSGFDYVEGPSITSEPQQRAYRDAMARINEAYQELMALGVPAQDARGVLPTNIATNICFKANLRTLHDMGLKRLCTKSQGEFQDVFRAMRAAVVEVHPWAKDMIQVHCAAYGTCMFPSYPTVKCPPKRLVLDPSTGEAYGGGAPGSLVQIQRVWEVERAEAQPGLPKEV